MRASVAAHIPDASILLSWPPFRQRGANRHLSLPAQQPRPHKKKNDADGNDAQGQTFLSTVLHSFNELLVRPLPSMPGREKLIRPALALVSLLWTFTLLITFAFGKTKQSNARINPRRAAHSIRRRKNDEKHPMEACGVE